MSIPVAKLFAIRHGLCHLSEYRAWQTMRLRCTNPKNKAYPDYGGRGITVCDKWFDDFPAFLRDMGRKPSPEYELDRKDNDLGYSPDNCRWVTRSQNDRNRRSNRWIEFRGERRLLVEICEQFGVRKDTIIWRMKSGMDLETALLTPVRDKIPNNRKPTKAYLVKRMTPVLISLLARVASFIRIKSDGSGLLSSVSLSPIDQGILRRSKAAGIVKASGRGINSMYLLPGSLTTHIRSVDEDVELCGSLCRIRGD